MIKKLWIDNYKALNEFEISFMPFTLLIGNNAVGKSSVMEAMDFLAGSVKESFDIVLERRKQTVQNIVSKLKASSKIRFVCEVELKIGNEQKILTWELQIRAFAEKNLMVLERERITDKAAETDYLLFDSEQGGFLKGKKKLELPALSYKISILNHIDTENDEKVFPELTTFKRFWERTAFFGMLSPEKMRASEKEPVSTIGRAGNKLPSFIQSMSAPRLLEYYKRLNGLMGEKIVSVSAKPNRTFDYVILHTVENYGGQKLDVTSEELSDGMLRILAIVAITEMDESYTLFMADEIENGINVNYLENLIKILKEACAKKQQQFIMTTHSTVFADYMDPKEMVYLFREDESGWVKAVSLFELPTFKERLKNFYPGEILLNLSNEEILAEMKEQE